MTPFALLATLCGLTQREAAQICGVREDTAKSWSTGRRTPPDRVIQQMRLLWHDIEAAADRISTADHEAEVITAMADADDAAAAAQGLPVGAAWRQAVALAYARQGGRPAMASGDDPAA